MRMTTPFLLARAARVAMMAAALAAPFFLTASHAQNASSAPANASPVPAQSSQKMGGAEVNVRRALEARLRPGTKIESVAKSPFFGLYEARVGSDLIYTDEKVTYIFLGSILDGKSLENLTEERLNKMTAVKFNELPLNDAIKMVNGTGKRQIAYFADPNCGYCKQFERSLTQLKDTTVYVFLFPILSEDSLVKSQALWCAPDRVKAWNDWMLRGQMAPLANCANPMESNRELGQRLNVRATPTTILGNGTKLPGAVPLAQLEKAVAENSPQ